LNRSRPARAGLALALWLAGASAVAGEPARAAVVEVAILHTNDLHGKQGRAGGLLETIRALRARHRESILLDAGDAFESKIPGAVESGGREMVEFMNGAGYDGRVPGDNDFVDFGLEDVLANLRRLAFPTLAANLRVKGEPLGLPYFVYQRGGATLAVIGVYGDHKSLARFGVEELSAEQTVRGLVSALKGRVDCIVLLSHSGVKRERGYARAVPGIDVIVGGSTHAALDPEVIGTTVIVRAEARGAAVGALLLEIDTDRDRVQRWRFERLPTGAPAAEP
jgi:2',3'-cyclic-nucleotide 2'-phosphodiesterase (5'-nucleotidase family)